MHTIQKVFISLLLVAGFAGCKGDQQSSSHPAKIDKLRGQKEELMKKIEASAAQITELLSSSPEGLHIVDDWCSVYCSDVALVGKELDIFFKAALAQLKDFLDKVEKSPNYVVILDTPAKFKMSQMSSDNGGWTVDVKAAVTAPLGPMIGALSSIIHKFLPISIHFTHFTESIKKKASGGTTIDIDEDKKRKLEANFYPTLSGLVADVAELVGVSGKIGKLSQEG